MAGNTANHTMQGEAGIQIDLPEKAGVVIVDVRFGASGGDGAAHGVGLAPARTRRA